MFDFAFILSLLYAPGALLERCLTAARVFHNLRFAVYKTTTIKITNINLYIIDISWLNTGCRRWTGICNLFTFTNECLTINWNALFICSTSRQHGLIGWLVNTERSICANCEGGKPAQSPMDGQWDTMHITLHYTVKMYTVHSIDNFVTSFPGNPNQSRVKCTV